MDFAERSFEFIFVFVLVYLLERELSVYRGIERKFYWKTQLMRDHRFREKCDEQNLCSWTIHTYTFHELPYSPFHLMNDSRQNSNNNTSSIFCMVSLAKIILYFASLNLLNIVFFYGQTMYYLYDHVIDVATVQLNWAGAELAQ